MQRRSVFRGRLVRASLWLALAGCAAGAHAQPRDESLYDGTWNVRLRCGASALCPARLVIEDWGGTWQDVSGKNPAKRACGGRKVPLTVQSSTRSLLAFTVWGDGDSPACPTLSILVKPIDAKTLEGTFETGTHATESPEVHASHSMPAAPSGAAAAKAEQAVAARMGSDRSVRLERR